MFGNREGRRKPEVVSLYPITIRWERSQLRFWISSFLHLFLGAARGKSCRKQTSTCAGVSLMGQEILAVSTASCCVGYMKPQHEIAPVLLEAAKGFLLPNLKDWAMLRAGQASSVVCESVSPGVGSWSSSPMCKGGASCNYR